MKSSDENLRKRGLATEDEISKLAGLPQTQLMKQLHSSDAVTRTAAACHLLARDRACALELLRQLANEKCLYTKIAICKTLERGGLDTAIQMAEFLGKIGNNQHKVLPDKVSKKKSFPLPRDIIARSLGKMNITVFPALMAILDSNDMVKIREGLDAIGFMVFYHQELATFENVLPVISLLKDYSDDPIIVWKAILCLSAFPLAESREALLMYSSNADFISLEAQRSLRLLENRI